MSAAARAGSIPGSRLVDAFGRVVTDLRISVTRRCNFGCVYCHDEGLGPVLPPRPPHADELSAEEIEERVAVAREFGIRSVKLTGGEPLLRQDLPEIVGRIVRHIPDVSLATNGSLLARRAEALRKAGLKRVNVSLDALDPAAFRRIRKGSLRSVLLGVRTALRQGLKPVKLNVVVFRETLLHIQRLIDFAAGSGGDLRVQLIQYMPEISRHPEWAVDIGAIRADLERRAEQVLVREMHHRRIYRLGGAEVEVVDPVGNAEFCANCRRLRMTHDGKLKGCLNRDDDLVSTRGLPLDGIRDAFRRAAAQRVPYYGAIVPASARPGALTLVPLPPTGT